MEKGTPMVTEMQVIPVAGYDSMLMTLSGCACAMVHQKSGDFEG